MPPAEPVAQVLASTLWEIGQDAKKKAALFSSRPGQKEGSRLMSKTARKFTEPPQKRRKIESARCLTGCRAIDDEVLGGGFAYGGVVGVACPTVRMGTELSYSTLTSHLLSSPSAHAYVIEPFKEFDSRSLSRSLLNRLRCENQGKSEASGFTHGGGYVYYPKDTVETTTIKDSEYKNKEQLEGRVKQAMDRVDLMRVFDFEGLIDSIMTIKDHLGNTPGLQVPNEYLQVFKRPPEVAKKHHLSPIQPTQSPSRLEIPDSEDEASSGEEKPLDLPSVSLKPVGITAVSSPAIATPAVPKITAKPTVDSLSKPQPPAKGPLLLILPYINHFLIPMLNINHTQAHAHLIHLHRRLRTLTSSSTHVLCLLLNTTKPLYSPPRSLDPPQQGRDPREGVRERKGKEREETVSVFESVRCAPSGLRAYEWGLDLNCLVSREGEGQRRFVFEILHDREEGRSGRWCVFKGFEKGG